jgi:hypothetical protein
MEYNSTVWRAINKLSFLNIMANFFVYSITIRSFRLFLKLKMSDLLTLLRRCFQQRAPLEERPSPTPTTSTIQINRNIQDTTTSTLQINRNIQDTSI